MLEEYQIRLSILQGKDDAECWPQDEQPHDQIDGCESEVEICHRPAVTEVVLRIDDRHHGQNQEIHRCEHDEVERKGYEDRFDPRLKDDEPCFTPVGALSFLLTAAASSVDA